jgi:hypothetical protein
MRARKRVSRWRRKLVDAYDDALDRAPEWMRTNPLQASLAVLALVVGITFAIATDKAQTMSLYKLTNGDVVILWSMMLVLGGGLKIAGLWSGYLTIRLAGVRLLMGCLLINVIAVLSLWRPAGSFNVAITLTVFLALVFDEHNLRRKLRVMT